VIQVHLHRHLLTLYHHLRPRHVHVLHHPLLHHHLLLHLHQLRRQLHHPLHRHHLLHYLRHTHDVVPVLDERHYLLVGLRHYLILGDQDGVVLLDHLVHRLPHQLLLQHRHRHRLLPLNQPLHQLLHHKLHRFQHLLHSLYISHVCLRHLHHLHLVLNNDPLLPRNLHRTVLLVDHLHLGRHLHRLGPLYHLVHRHLPVLSVDHWLLYVLGYLDWHLLHDLDRVVVADRHADLVVHHLGLSHRHHLRCLLTQHVLLRYSYDVVHHLLYILWHLHHPWHRSEQRQYRINVHQVQNLRSDHPHHALIYLQGQAMFEL
jgi:hypothetical protein